MSLDVDALTSQSDVGVQPAVAQRGHEGGGSVHPGKECFGIKTENVW